jgi:hypothetical protein
MGLKEMDARQSRCWGSWKCRKQEENKQTMGEGLPIVVISRQFFYKPDLPTTVRR